MNVFGAIFCFANVDKSESIQQFARRVPSMGASMCFKSGDVYFLALSGFTTNGANSLAQLAASHFNAKTKKWSCQNELRSRA